MISLLIALLVAVIGGAVAGLMFVGSLMVLNIFVPIKAEKFRIPIGVGLMMVGVILCLTLLPTLTGGIP